MCPAPRPSPYTCPTAFSRVLPAMWSCHTYHRRRRNPKFARPGARGRVAEGDSSIVLPPTAQPNPTQNGRNRKPLYEPRLLRRPRPSEASKVPRKAQRRAGRAGGSPQVSGGDKATIDLHVAEVCMQRQPTLCRSPASGGGGTWRRLSQRHHRRRPSRNDAPKNSV